jgi:hypothetical protein
LPRGRKLVTTMLAPAAATGTLCTASRGEALSFSAAVADESEPAKGTARSR